MSYLPNGKGMDNDNPQMIAVTYATSSLSEDEQQELSEAQAIAPEMVQVVTIDGDSSEIIQQSAPAALQQQGIPPSQQPHLQQQQQQQQQQGQGQGQGQGQEPLSLPEPGMVHVVTFDEQPSAGDVTDGLQQDGFQQQESTPLLHQSSSGSGGMTSHIPFGNNGNDHNDNDNEDGKDGGGAQCYNLPWAILFWAHIATVVYAGTQLAPQGYAMIENDDFDLNQVHDFMQRNFVNDDDFTEKDLDMLTDFLHQFQDWWAIYPPRICWFAFAIGGVSFCLNMFKNHFVIRKKALMFVTSSVVFPGVIFGAILLLNLPNLGFVGFLFCAVVAVALAIFVRKELWPKLHFAAVNLEVALTGIGSNLGVYLWVQACAEATVLWVIFWCYTFFGMIPYVTGKSCPEMAQEFDPNSDESCPATGRVLLLLLLSLYWTVAFVGNTVQVYVAGVMATWCFEKDSAKGFCSSAVTSSMYRSLTFSAGPIAFGSLLQGACKVLRSILSHSNRNQHRSNQLVYDSGDDCRCCCFGLCGLVMECLSELFGEVLDYFNQWAYCFVGINGASYLDSGKAAMNLFKTRGWTAVITDRLVALVLNVGILESGIATGLAAVGMERIVTWIAYPADHTDLPPSYIFGPPSSVGWASFIFGFVVGCVMCGIMMNVIHGAVNTVIVCWAESPESFKDNHKYLAGEMTEVWSSAFPGTQIQEARNSAPAGTISTGGYGSTAVAVLS